MNWSRSDLLEVIALSERQVIRLFKTGAVVPSIKVPANRGSEALYSDQDLLLLLVAEIVYRLCGQARTELVRSAAKALSSVESQGKILVLEAGGGGYLADRAVVSEELGSAQGRLLFSIEALNDDLSGRIRRIGASG